MGDFYADKYWNGRYFAPRYWQSSDGSGATIGEMVAALTGSATVSGDLRTIRARHRRGRWKRRYQDIEDQIATAYVAAVETVAEAPDDIAKKAAAAVFGKAPKSLAPSVASIDFNAVLSDLKSAERLLERLQSLAAERRKAEEEEEEAVFILLAA